MSKGMIVFASFFIFMLCTSIVAAAGSSTGGSSSGSSTASVDASVSVRANTSTNSTSSASTNASAKTSVSVRANKTRSFISADCDSFDTRKERIHCRLTQETFEGNATIEESCRGTSNVRACERLYVTSEKCYELAGKQKDQCFKRIAGFTKAQLAQQAQENKTAVRPYMVLVLYNLQERVEKFQEQGKISAEDAALLIDKIVDTKQAILNNANKTEVRAKVSDLKAEWRLLIQANATASNSTG
ncbi:hypothetical protein HYZ97_01915 [Candidatus Pacearchaeota archaeon]|nr:hypothetical protein [Candidatus Pacearchaeota archaeon]